MARAAAAFLADRGNLDVVCEVALGDVQTNASYEDYFGLSPARRDDAVQRRIEGRLVTVLADALEGVPSLEALADGEDYAVGAGAVELAFHVPELDADIRASSSGT